MALGKQITTYLRGGVATAYEEALKEEKKTSYALLTDMVEEYLALRGYITAKQKLIPVVGPALEKYNAEQERLAVSIRENYPGVVERILGEADTAGADRALVAKRPLRRRRRRPA